MNLEQVEKVATDMTDANVIVFVCPNSDYSAIFAPTGSENKQLLIVNDYLEYTMKLYKRQRKDKDSPWEKWEFKSEIVVDDKKI